MAVNEYPPIDIRFKAKKTLFGNVKRVPTSIEEQRAMAAEIKKKNPKIRIISDLSDEDWIDEIEEFVSIFED